MDEFETKRIINKIGFGFVEYDKCSDCTYCKIVLTWSGECLKYNFNIYDRYNMICDEFTKGV